MLAGCGNSTAKQSAAAPPPQQAMPVQTMTVASTPVAQSDEYVATVRSRRSATINPQVSGNITQIVARSGDHVKAGQLLMVIDPTKQEATVASAKATEQQLLAVYQYNQGQDQRQQKLFAAGIISRDAFDQAEQSFKNSKAAYESAAATLKTQQQELGYYKITAPFTGVVGDIPVHLGDYVSPTTLLTTVDADTDLEAYIYVPTNRSSEVHPGLAVDILDSTGKVVDHTKIYFVSPQVDNQLQGILAKAKLHPSPGLIRSDQQVKARVIWSTKPMPVVPVLAVSRLGGQAFVFVAQPQGNGKYVATQTPVDLGDTVGNNYAVLSGLKDGEKVIVSGTQFLRDGAPVQPLG
jgi:RND family efflux transporter MFP subunit